MYFSEEANVHERMGHRTGDWTDQVQKGVEDLSVNIIIKVISSA